MREGVNLGVVDMWMVFKAQRQKRSHPGVRVGREDTFGNTCLGADGWGAGRSQGRGVLKLSEGPSSH